MALYTNGRPQPTSAAIPHRVTGQYLARNQLGKRPRARLAADISAGKVIVTDFTIKQSGEYLPGVDPLHRQGSSRRAEATGSGGEVTARLGHRHS
jgi:hypothetical protein